MEKEVVWVGIILVILAALCAFIPFSYMPAPQGTAKDGAASPALDADLLPLYAAVAWSAPSAYSRTLATSTVIGAITRAVAATSTMNVAAATAPFAQYYRAKLLPLGWQIDTTLEAGGPGSGQTVYRKGSQIIILSFASVFHERQENTPEQCPCGVTLSLFSSGQ